MSPEQQQPRASSSIVRDLNCRIAFVAAITTPLDGSLSARTKEFTESMFTSALSKHYSACAVVLTNRAGSFDFLRPRLRSFQEVVYERFWGGEDTYMYDRTRSYVRFLAEEAQAKEPRDLVFTDTDILFIKSLNEVFDLPFDVGLTYRLMPKYPINNGIMFAHHSRLVEV